MNGDTTRLDRALRYACPVLLLIIASNLLNGILRGPQWMWNEIRLAPGFALAYGYHLYPAQHSLGPIVGTLYTPVGHILYAGLAFLKDPTWALMAGCTLSIVLYFTPLLWVHLRCGGGRLISIYGFLACAAIVLASPGTNYSALNIHVDASAVAAAVMATGIIATARASMSFRALACSAALGILSIACKQTMMPVPIALACFVLLADGPRIFFRYVLLQLVSALLIGGAVLLLFWPPQDLLFSTWWLAIHRPLVAGVAKVMEAMAEERYTLGAVIPVLVILIANLLWFQAGSMRSRLQTNRWLAFLLVAVFQAPFALRAWITAGGDFNHLGVITVFAALAATVGLTVATIPALVQRMLLVGIIGATLPLPWNLPDAVRGFDQSPAAVAFRYEQRHPGRVYFPMEPLVPLLARGTPTHLDISLSERADAGSPITPEEFASGLPPHYQLIAYPPSYEMPGSPQVRGLLRSMQRVHEPGLEGWRVFGPVPDTVH